MHPISVVEREARKLARWNWTEAVRKTWVLPLCLFVLGLVIWALPLLFCVGESGGNLSDLGSAIAGGAVVALVVLILERQFAAEADRSNKQLQLALQKQATELEVGLRKGAPGVGLRSRDLKGIHWRYVDLNDADLTEADFTTATVWDCNLDGAFAWGIVCVRADLQRSTFRGADLGGADFSEAILADAVFLGANCGVGTYRGKVYSSANFAGAVLHDAVFAGANLRNVNLDGAELQGADLVGANLSGARVNGAKFAGADVSQADLRYVSLQLADLTNVRHDDLTMWPEGFDPGSKGD